MKLEAARTVDRPDMIKLWPHTGFESARAAVSRYRDAYPHAAEDEYLERFVADETASQGGVSSPAMRRSRKALSGAVAASVRARR
jgi:transposase